MEDVSIPEELLILILHAADIATSRHDTKGAT